MKSKFKKYFLTSLAFMLIFSNFSYATTYMICSMGKDDAPCCCKHKSSSPAKELTITSEKTICCGEGRIELANTNLLSTVKIEVPADITSFSPELINTNNLILIDNNISFSYIAQIEHVPKSDIPILTSSLLIWFKTHLVLFFRLNYFHYWKH